ncbi:MAG TPA: amino acid permease [Blastocatellia bacterium]|nr:amino acid permease [Blastocatellia bacterium]
MSDSAVEVDRGGLPRKLGLFSAIAVLVGSTIGSGIFRSPAGIAGKIPSEPLYILCWVLGGLFALCGALTYAELAGALPHTGGVFVYIYEGFGKLPAFLFGWSELVVIRASALGAVATVFAEYLLRLLKVQNAAAVHYVAAAAVVLIAIVNLVGISIGAVVQNLTAAAKFGALVVLVIVAFALGDRNPSAVQSAAVPAMLSGSGVALSRFGLALISVMWVYDGWADLTFLSGEVKRPQRNLPAALISGTLLIVGIYLVANFSYLHILDVGKIAGSKLVAADVASSAIGPAGVGLVSIAVMIAAFGTLNGSMMTGPRIFFAMADSGLFFKKIAAVHPRYKTPYVAILLAAVLAIIFVSVQTFEQLADTFVLAIWPFYALGVASIYTLRRRRPDMPRPYKTPGYPITPVVFLLASLYLLGNALGDDVVHFGSKLIGAKTSTESSGALLVLAIILGGIPAYYLWNKFQGRSISRG